jgi:SAM-dependent methyltransferase
MTADEQYLGTEGTRPYAGTSEYYAAHRPRMGDGFRSLLATSLGWTTESRVLDLGTGPGHVALRIASLVGEVIGVDPEPDMLETATRLARQQNTPNVSFHLGSSDDILQLGLGQFDSVTMSSSFHWMLDKDRVMADLDQMTNAARASVAFVSTGSIVGDATAFNAAAVPIRELLDRYLAGTDEGPHPRGRHDDFGDILKRSAFSDVHEIEADHEGDADLSADALLGFWFSLSHVLTRLGDRRAALQEEARSLVASLGTPSTTRVTYRDRALFGLR